MLSLVKALKLAESLEESRAETYKKYLKIVKFPAGKKVLRFLVKSENIHLNFLIEQSKRLEKGERVLYSKLHQPEIVFPLSEDSSESLIRSSAKDIEILKVVSDFEKYDVKFYEYLYTKTENSECKKLFKKLAGIEENHLKLVNKMLKLADR